MDEARTSTAGFEEAKLGLHATRASVSAFEVVETLDRHGREEADLLSRYEQYVAQTGSPVAKYLVSIIVDEERRHHRMLEELANTIAWSHMGDAALPQLPHETVDRRPDPFIRRETRALIRHERQDRRKIGTLGRRLRRYGDVPLWTLLTELMRLDTEKHVSILRFIEKDNRSRHLLGFWTRASARIRRAWTT